MTPTTSQVDPRHDTLVGVTGRSGRGTARQTIRMDEEQWEKLGASAAAVGKDRSAVVRALVDWFNRQPGAELPERPAADDE